MFAKPSTESLKLMIKRGVAPGAVKIIADREGIDFNLVMLDEENTSATNIPATLGTGSQDGKDHTQSQDGTDHTQSQDGKDHKQLFQACESAGGVVEVQFFVPKNGKEADLIGLVRKMVLTVRKGYRGSMEEKYLKVKAHDLYNAIGSFRGVQHARDTYNSTCDASKKLSEHEIRFLRKPFLEQLVALTIRSPVEMHAEVNITGLDEFVRLIEKIHEKEIQAVEDDSQLGLCNFDSLSEMYKPGMQVVCKDAFTAGVDMLAEVAWSRYEQGRSIFGITRSFRICFHFFVAVGNHFTLCEFVEAIEQFNGHRNIQGMPFVPLHCYDSHTSKQMMEKFRCRGEIYSNCGTGSHFLEYGKGCFFAKGNTKSRQSSSAALQASGRVMVDTQGSYEAGFSPSIGNMSMVEGIHYKFKEYMLQMRQSKQSVVGRNMLGAGKDGATSQMHTSDDGMIIFDKVPSKFINMTWPAVVGFSFTSKSWGDIIVDGISKIKFEESTFDKLVLPSARKRMIRALVRHSNTSFSDIISGKGEGSVFLLYGPPGVGKTLTAEAISEMLHRPLYSISLGQLGTSPEELEKKLGEILELCGKWNAIVLLDEADVLLEKRSASGSLERNAMVSVMLRLVEYFRGVLFLTSNRINSLDPAFQTRITLALRYENLDKAARAQVWKNILVSSGHGPLVAGGSIDVSKLAESELNGREIKNSIRLSMALAEEDGTEFSQEIILETVEVLLDFNQKMSTAEDF